MRFLQLRFSVIYAVLEIIIVCHICAFIGNNFCSNFEKKKNNIGIGRYKKISARLES